MAKHHDYKADTHSLYNHPYRELICYWVVQYNREPWARQYDYLASLTKNCRRGGTMTLKDTHVNIKGDSLM